MDLNRRTALQMLGATAGMALVGAPSLSVAQDGTKTLVIALDEIAKQLDPLEAIPRCRAARAAITAACAVGANSPGEG